MITLENFRKFVKTNSQNNLKETRQSITYLSKKTSLL